jgi:hypothetical protein
LMAQATPDAWPCSTWTTPCCRSIPTTPGAFHHPDRLDRPGGVCPAQRRVLCPVPGRHAGHPRLRALCHRGHAPEGPGGRAGRHATSCRRSCSRRSVPRRWPWCGHQAAGDAVAIITATNEFVTRPIADAFGVRRPDGGGAGADTTGGTGWLTGEIRGVPSAREGKVVRVDSGWRARPGLGRRAQTFYSDSTNDLPCWSA